MLITTFGPPSGYTQFCLHLMRLLTDEALKDIDYLSAGNLDQLKDAWAARHKPHVFFFADCPERPLVDVFLKLRAPAVVFMEEPDDVTGYIARERGMSWAWALRLTHQCLVAIGDLILSDATLVLRRDYELTVREFFRAIAHHFQIQVTTAHLEAVTAKAGLTGEYDLDTSLETLLLARWQHARAAQHGLDDLPRSEGRIIRAVNAPLKAMIAGRAVERFPWPQEMFIPGDQPNEVLLGTIEMVGPARCLCYGPFLHLPMGEWDVALELEVGDNRSGNRFDIDIYHGEVIALESFAVPAAGKFMLQARFAVRDPREPIQIRIIMREGAIEGTLDVKSAVVQAADQAAVNRTSG